MYKGKKTLLENGMVQVDLMNGTDIIYTHTVENDNTANAYVIPWVSQKGYADSTITSENHVIDWDNFDEVYLYND